MTPSVLFPRTDDVEVNSDVEDASDDSLEDPKVTTTQTYNNLLQALKRSNPSPRHAKKKRKLRHHADAIDSSALNASLIQAAQISHHEKQTKLDRGLLNDHASNGANEQIEVVEDAPTEADEDLVVEEMDAESDGIEDEESDDETLATMDPFEQRFTRPDADLQSEKISSIKQDNWATRKMSFKPLGDCFLTTPGIPKEAHTHEPTVSLRPLKIKQRLMETAKRVTPSLDNIQQALATPLFNYSDVLFADRSTKSAQSIRQLYSMHTLNHLLKTRQRVIKNNAKLVQEPENPDLELRDQGFTRPKVLILLETRQACVQVVDNLAKLFEPQQQENRQRFQDAFNEPLGKFENKPADFLELFDGNDDNDFRIGVKLTRKTMKFFSTFYNSDIIFASPLGLRRAIDSKQSGKGDFDYLSSIEILIIDQVSAMLMQNWSHVTYILPFLNRQPTALHSTDFSRVRHAYLDGDSPYLRQTIVIASYLTPELNQLASSHMRNVAGRIKYKATYDDSVLSKATNLGIRQIFSRFSSPSPMAEPDARFKYFDTAVLSSVLKAHAASGGTSESGTLIFIHDYAALTRLQLYLSNLPEALSISSSTISEYSTTSEVSRARTLFSDGRSSFLLYTQRAHHFRRHNRIRGVKKIIFYGLPDNRTFYSELVSGFLGESLMEGGLKQPLVKVLFSKWDVLKLERIVGSSRVGGMVKNTVGDTFEFI